MATPDNEANEPIHEICGWKLVLLTPVGWFVRLWGASLHFSMTPGTREVFRKADEAVAFVLWHNRLFLVSEIHRRFRPQRRVYGLVSASKDGAWLDAFFKLVGIHSVRGSTSKNAREAVHALTEVMKAGHDIGITPDGPRGPLYDFKAGGLIVARRAKAPLLLIGADFERSVQVRSWDRFHIPHPFSTVYLTCKQVASRNEQDREHAVAALKEHMLRTNPDRGRDPGVVV